MSKFEQILTLITNYFGDDFENGELDALIYNIIDIMGGE